MSLAHKVTIYGKYAVDINSDVSKGNICSYGFNLALF